MIVRLILLFAIFGYSTSALKPSFQCQPVNGGSLSVLSDGYVASEFGIHKIHATVRKNWNDARSTYQDENAQLVIIDSIEEETLLYKYIKESNIFSLWIGVHDLFVKDDWTTVRGERLYSLDYVHWAKGEPNNSGGNERCVHLAQNGLNDLTCNGSNYFACERLIATWRCIWTSP